MGWFGSHGANLTRALEQKRKQKTQPNLRKPFDYQSRKGISKIEHKQQKALSAQELQELRDKIRQENKKHNKKLALAIVITLLICLIAFWGVPRVVSKMHKGGSLKVPALQNE